jgi:hypothetical protein
MRPNVRSQDGPPAAPGTCGLPDCIARGGFPPGDGLSPSGVFILHFQVKAMNNPMDDGRQENADRG